MAEIYKLIHPGKYFNDYISRNVRPDGRKFHEQRNIKVNVNSLKTAEASAVVKCGNTTVVCGVQLGINVDSKLQWRNHLHILPNRLCSAAYAVKTIRNLTDEMTARLVYFAYFHSVMSYGELATPKAEEPEFGYLVTNLELPALCSSKYKPGPPSDQAQVMSHLVSDIVMNSKCIDLKDLCIVQDKLAWVVYCDIICLDNDGSLIDASVIGVISSLKTLRLPSVTYDSETEEIKVDPDVRSPLKVHGLPVATSFAVYTLPDRQVLITDPSAYEEDMCGGIGSNFIVSSNKGVLCGCQKFGASNLLPDIQDEALKIANERAKLVEKVIETCISNDKIS